MKVLIAGAAGLVGSHLARRLALEHEVVALAHGDLDITNRDAVRRHVFHEKPALIVNCAVLQVDESEQEPAHARAVNSDGPRILAEAANGVGAEIVHFSTQYAFDGEPLGRLPYTIDDDPRPVNNYGRTKAAGEAAVSGVCARSFIVRTSWVYGRGKNSFLCTVADDLKAGKKVTAIDDIWSSTTYVVDLIERVMAIRATGRFGTYHVVNEGVCTYYDFALEAGRLLGLTRARIDSLIKVTHERDMKRVAVRPRYTPLRCLLSEQLGLPPMRDWRSALADYIANG
jgi:dTDP-4-dehydrorhamnose reductase